MDGYEAAPDEPRCPAPADRLGLEEGRFQPYCRQHARRLKTGKRRTPLAVPALPNPFGRIRFGPLGRLEHGAPDPARTPAWRISTFTDFLQAHAFHAYGSKEPSGIRLGDAPQWRLFSDHYGIEGHWFTDDLHPTDMESVHRHSLRNMSIQALHTKHRAAHVLGMASYTIQPPRDQDPRGGDDWKAMTVQDFAAEVGALGDLARSEGLHSRLHVTNGTNDHRFTLIKQKGGRLLWDLDDLVYFTRELDVTPTLHSGHEHLCRNPEASTDRQRGVDEWKTLLKRCPEGTLIVHSGTQYTEPEHGHKGLAGDVGAFADDQTSRPSFTPLLEAILETRRETTILLEGGAPEQDALNAMAYAAARMDVDLAKALEERILAYDEPSVHPRLVRYLAPPQAKTGRS